MTVPKKRRLLVSVSGGKTSAFMGRMLQLGFSDQYELLFVFANTGQENEATLEFMRRCDEEWGWDATWVEAVVHPRRNKGTTHRIVNFETACRDGSLFDAMCAKFGIPNKSFPHCTRELKRRPIYSYLRSIGWGSPSEFDTALGIRTDELRRAKPSTEYSVVYPLVDWFPSDKQDVNDFWETMPWNLQLKEYQGNCKWCWKKSAAKLYRIAGDDPRVFDVPMALEEKHGRSGPLHRKDPDAPPNVFFRERTSTAQLLAQARIWLAGNAPAPREDDEPGGCGEACEFIETEEVAPL